MERVPSASATRLVVLLALLALILSSCGGTGSTAQPTAPPAAPAATAAASSGGAAPTAAGAAQPSGDAGEIIFLSNQFKPVEEAERMRNTILSGFSGKVEFIPEDPGPFNDRIRAEAQGGQKTVSLIGGLHGDLSAFVKEDLLEDLTPLMDKLKDRGFPAPFVELSKFGTDKIYYIPWMQATYVLAANKKALQYLPQGADQNALTYDQLKEWGQNIQKATGDRKLGFPGGPKGLIHRLFQGYLYPSYTGSAGVVGFKAPEATQMWTTFKDLWALANPQSANYEFMQEPLLSEEVWVAMDHTARLINAVKEKPDDFVILPAPAGPKGRGFMPVIAGFAIPKGAPNRAGAEQLIDYLTMPEQQLTTLRENAFFPVVKADTPTDLNPGTKLEADAVQKQSTAKDGLPSLLPVGLGAKGGEFNKVYLDSFQQIVINNQPIEQVLQQQAATLQQIMNDTKAGCWAPDPPSEGPCQVK
jgi:multiple sugar transport system substrate-binding protein